MYSFTFNDLKTTYVEFNEMINNDFSLKALALSAAENDIATNLLVWMHYRINVITHNQKRQAMKLYSSPSDAFDRASIEAGAYVNIGGNHASCASSYTSFDTTTATVLLSFPNSSDCRPFITGLGKLGRFDGDLFEVKMKLTSFTTVAGINSDILTMEHLERLAVIDVLTIGDQTLAVNAMYDPTYKRADTFVCSDLGDANYGLKDKMQQLCVIDARGLLLLPNLGHADEHCASCDDDASKATVPCQYFGMLPFYIFFPLLKGDRTAQAFALLDFFQRVNRTEIRKAVSRMYQNQDTALFDQLCPQCGLIWVYLGDEKNTVSPYRRQIPGGIHCVDSITSANFSALGSSPPAQLVENYYECRDTVTNNILNSVGLAFGNTSVFAVLFLAMFLPVLFYLTKKFDPHKKHVRKYVHGESGRSFGSALVSRKISAESLESSENSIVELESPYDLESRKGTSAVSGRALHSPCATSSRDYTGSDTDGIEPYSPYPYLAEKSPPIVAIDAVLSSSMEEESKRKDEGDFICDLNDEDVEDDADDVDHKKVEYVTQDCITDARVDSESECDECDPHFLESDSIDTSETSVTSQNLSVKVRFPLFQTHKCSDSRQQEKEEEQEQDSNGNDNNVIGSRKGDQEHEQEQDSPV